MKKVYLATLMSCALYANTFAQSAFEKKIEVKKFDYLSSEILMPVSPLKLTPIFIGGVDMVQTTATYGNAAGEVVSKDWNDFIGVTPEKDAQGVYTGSFWVTINHEKIEANDNIGDGGGMTVFKVKEDANGELTVVDQTLPDGRKGKYFNVDFANTVGETGMNCGGIVGPNGRIWTAEEWFRTSDESLAGQFRNMSAVTITSDIDGDFNGKVVDKYQTLNWMTEIDPKEAKAVRKQYNWGRQGFEGGAISNDQKTVYLGVDATPSFWCKFVAETPGDYTKGDLFVYKQDEEKWVKIDNTKMDDMLNFDAKAVEAKATMFNRIEWVTIDRKTGIIYMTETGRDNPGSRWADEKVAGSDFAQHHKDRASAQGTTPETDDYADYYGRILKFDPSTNKLTVHLEAGAADAKYDNKESVSIKNYPDIHLSNPDGLSTMEIGGKTFFLVQEDLNGTSHNRMPYGVSNRTCELFLLDATNPAPTVKDLIRITAVPHGAEITGATSTPSGKAILVNSQHPESNDMVNDYPYNHSLTVAISGFEGIVQAATAPQEFSTEGFTVYPNPVARELHLNKVTDVAIYDNLGKRVLVARNTDVINISSLASGSYIVLSKDNEAQKIIIE